MNIPIKDILPLLRCPESHSALHLENDFLVNESGVRYPVQNGIINLVKKDHQEKNQIVEEGYNKLKSLKYDLLILNPPFMTFTWGLGLLMAPLYMFKLLEVPLGWILDVPCGSGVFSIPIYKSNPCAKFISIDYSMEMLKAAQSRAKKKGIDNVIFIRADVSDLPFMDCIFNSAFSFAGFHAFPEPSVAGIEISRVLFLNLFGPRQKQ